MLAVVHHVRAHYPSREQLFDASRGVLRGQIAEWTVEHVGLRSADAVMCALVIDNMAAALVNAERLLGAEPPTGAEPLHVAWSDVGRLATQWSDLVAEVIHGQPPLPRR